MHSEIANNFQNFLNALAVSSPLSKNEDITYAIYYDLFKIRQAQWQYKIRFDRQIDYSLSDIFQDIIAHYLRRILPEDYSLHLELKKDNLRPDILIKKKGINWAAIEIKTTIGWNRDLVKEEEYLRRLEKISLVFSIPLKRIFYIFEASRNVNSGFAEIFKSNEYNKIKEHIFPLFEMGASPYYLTKKRKKNEIRNYSEEEIFEFYKKNKIADFQEIVNKITLDLD